MLGESLCIIWQRDVIRIQQMSHTAPENRNIKPTYLPPPHQDQFSTRVFIPTFYLFLSTWLPADI